jgi:hypothetical protein
MRKFESGHFTSDFRKIFSYKCELAGMSYLNDIAPVPSIKGEVFG